MATKKATGASKKGKSRRGFASMDPELVREISRRGGIAAHEQGTAHEFTKQEARAAGRKGGLAPRRRTAAKKK
jgi:general stress protein YciG